METCDWSDALLIRYIIGLIVYLFGAGLFFWWWIKKGKASFIYMSVTFLFLGDAFEKAIQVYGRVLRLMTNSTAFSENSLWWVVKGDIRVLASAVIIIYLLMRALGYLPLQANRE